MGMIMSKNQKRQASTQERFIRGAAAGFFVLPLLATTNFHPVSGKNAVKQSWSRVNGYLSNGVSRVASTHERTKKPG